MFSRPTGLLPLGIEDGIARHSALCRRSIQIGDWWRIGTADRANDSTGKLLKLLVGQLGRVVVSFDFVVHVSLLVNSHPAGDLGLDWHWYVSISHHSWGMIRFNCY